MVTQGVPRSRRALSRHVIPRRTPTKESTPMTTLRQIEANRRNAQKSTGPAEAGKLVSRGNALKHGLAGDGVVLPDDETERVEKRMAECAAVIRPACPLEAFYVAQMAVEGVRVERCQREERALLLRRAAWAESGWDEDRRLSAEETGARLSRDPARVVRRLRQTAQGCDWLRERWQALANSLETGRPWDEARRGLALDLLGVPPALREGLTLVDPAPGEDAVEHQAALAAGRIAELDELKAEVMEDRDVIERDAAVEGTGPGDAATERLLAFTRRYESACQRRLDRAMHLLLAGRLMERTLPAVVERSARPSEPKSSAVPPSRPEPAVADRATEPDPQPAATEPRKGNRRWRRAQQRQARERDRRATPSPITAAAG
jgi:hypothetical protein